MPVLHRYTFIAEQLDHPLDLHRDLEITVRYTYIPRENDYFDAREGVGCPGHGAYIEFYDASYVGRAGNRVELDPVSHLGELLLTQALFDKITEQHEE